jgi:hypothetical protein
VSQILLSMVKLKPRLKAEVTPLHISSKPNEDITDETKEMQSWSKKHNIGAKMQFISSEEQLRSYSI